MPRRASALACVWLAAVTARAAASPTLSLRELTVRADVVVVAAPLDVRTPGRLRVRELIKGAAPRAGTELTVDGLDAYVRPREQPAWAGVDAALLFLRIGPGGHLFPLESGVRLLTRDGTLWWPAGEPGVIRRMVPEHGVSWDAALFRVREDATEMAKLFAARGLADATRRDHALLDWVERNRNEFSDGDRPEAPRTPGPGGRAVPPSVVADLETRGWGELQLLPFDQVLQGKVPADCWAAVNLYAEVNSGAAPRSAAAAFAGREGRALLVAVARDGRQLAGRRARALRLLADPAVGVSDVPGAAERAALLEALLPLLSDKQPACRGLGALAARQITGEDGAAIERVVAALAAAYSAEPPGPARNAQAEVLYDLPGSSGGMVRTGRWRGGLALLRDLELRDDKLCFWLTHKPGTTAPAGTPTLWLERLNSQGGVAETKKMPFPATPPSRLAAWRGGPLYAELSHGALNPGTWRLRVTGVSGADKLPWESEPRTFRIGQAASARARQGGSVLGSLLRSAIGVPDPPQLMPGPEEKPRRTVTTDGEAF